MVCVRGDLKSRSSFDGIKPFVRILPVEEQTALITSTIRRDIRSGKLPVRDRALDILIAATAIEHDLVLLTRNIRHFQDIDGLRILTNDPT